MREFSEGIRSDEGKVRQHVEEVVRASLERTLNGLLEARPTSCQGGVVPRYYLEMKSNPHRLI